MLIFIIILINFIKIKIIVINSIFNQSFDLIKKHYY